MQVKMRPTKGVAVAPRRVAAVAARRGRGGKKEEPPPPPPERSPSSSEWSDSDDESTKVVKKPWKHVKHNPKLVLAEGQFLHKQGNLKQAIGTLDKVIEKDPDDVESLLTRSKCHLDNGNLEQALKDADAARKSYNKAKDDPFMKSVNPDTDWMTLFQKAESLFALGHFEEALMLYYRIKAMRPNVQQIKTCIAKCKEAITNTTIPDVPKKKSLRGSGVAKSLPSLAASPSPSWNIAGSKSQNTTTPRKRRRRRGILADQSVQNDMGHVQKLNGTQRYLQKLLEEIDPKSSLGKEIKAITNESLQFVNVRDKYWKQQLPVAAVKKLENIEEAKTTPRKDVSLFEYILAEMKRIKRDYNLGRFQDCLRMADKCMNSLDMYPEDEIANTREDKFKGISKKEVQGKLHSYMGSSHYELGNLQDALKHHQKDYDFAIQTDNKKAEGRALDNIGKVHSKMGQHQKAITAWEKKIPLCTAPAEFSWLYQELGYCHLHLKDGVNATSYGEKAYQAASEDNNFRSQMTSYMLVGQAEVINGSYDAALEKFQQSLELANILADKEAVDTITSAMQQVNDLIVGRNDPDVPISGLSTDTDVTLPPNLNDSTSPPQDNPDAGTEGSGGGHNSDKQFVTPIDNNRSNDAGTHGNDNGANQRQNKAGTISESKTNFTAKNKSNPLKHVTSRYLDIPKRKTRVVRVNEEEDIEIPRLDLSKLETSSNRSSEQKSLANHPLYGTVKPNNPYKSKPIRVPTVQNEKPWKAGKGPSKNGVFLLTEIEEKSQNGEPINNIGLLKSKDRHIGQSNRRRSDKKPTHKLEVLEGHGEKISLGESLATVQE